jgi:hypothetical protein
MIERRAAETSRSRGSASIELIGMLPYLLLAALFAWQVLLSAFTAVNVENAARNGSRVEGRGGDGRQAAIDSLAPFLRSGADIEVDGEITTVTARLPIVLPALTNDELTITRDARLPSTD